MRQAYSKEIEHKVIELIVSGYNFQEISTQVGVSVGYVSSVKEKYEDKLGKGELEATHEFFKIVRKLGIAPQQLLTGTRTFSLLRENKLKVEELELFLQKVSKILEEKDFELLTIIDAYEKILILQSKSKVPLEHLATECENLVNKSIKLQNEIAELVDAKNKAETELKNSLKNAKVTNENIQQFVNIKNELQKNDIDYSNLPKLCTILKRSEENNFDFQKIRKHLGRETNYESRIAQLEDRIRTLEAREANLQAKNEEISGKITQNKDKLQQAEHLKKLRIPTPDFIQFSKKIVEISKMHDIPPKNAFSIFVKSLAKYDALKGFQKELERIKNEIEKKSSELEILNQKCKNFEMKYKEYSNVMKAINELKQKGIDGNSIIEWKDIFTTSKINSKEFTKQLRETGDLNKIKEIQSQKVNKLTKELKRLESRKKWIEEYIEDQESKLKQVNTLIKENLESNITIIKETVADFNSFVANSIYEMNESITKNLESLDKKTINEQQKILSNLQELVAKLMKESEKYGNLSWLQSFHEFVFDEKFVSSKNIPIVIMILDKLYRQCASRNYSNELLSSMKKLREDLEQVLITNG